MHGETVQISKNSGTIVTTMEFLCNIIGKPQDVLVVGGEILNKNYFSEKQKP